MEEKKSGAKKLSIFLAIISLLLFEASTLLVPMNDYLLTGLIRFGVGLLIILVMWPCLKGKYLKTNKEAWKKSFKYFWLLLLATFIYVAIMFFIDYFGAIKNGTLVVSDKWPITLLQIAVFCMGVGTSEEIIFRRGLFGGSLEQPTKKKKNVLRRAIITSIVFGYVHVFILFTGDVLGTTTAILKTIQSGMFGFIFCGAMIDSKEIWSLCIFHAINDFIPLALTIFTTDVQLGQYASSDAGTAYQLIIMYILFIIIYLPGVIKSYKILKNTNIE